MENTQEFDTIVGEDVELAGSIKNSGSILINGTVKGDVISDESVVVGVNAKVVGPIRAQNVQVAGAVEGSIEALETLEMLPESRVEGDVKVKTLNVQPGATFNGSSTMSVGTSSTSEPVEDQLASLKKSVANEDTDEEDVEEEVEDEEVVEEDEKDEVPAKKAKPKLELEE